jgi:predicted nucleotidyltransferase
MRMLSPEHIASAARRLTATAAHPAKVILFGFYGRGEADEASDLDLMVVEEGLTDKAREYLRLKEAVGHAGVGIDLLLMSAQEYDRRSQVPGTAVY